LATFKKVPKTLTGCINDFWFINLCSLYDYAGNKIAKKTKELYNGG
jgi:hypothetical protein